MEHPLDRIRELLEDARSEFPPSPKVNRLVVYDDLDTIGDPSLFIWVLFDDETPGSEQTREKVAPLKDSIVRTLREAGETRWPYVRFRTDSEYREMIEA